MYVEQDGQGPQEGAEGQEQDPTPQVGTDPNANANVEPGQDPNANADPNPDPDPKGDPDTSAKTYDEDYVKGLRRESAGYRTKLSNANKEIEALRAGQESGMQEL